MPAGYSGIPLAQKLGIVEGSTVAIIAEPPDFRDLLVPIPDGVAFRTWITATDPFGRDFTTHPLLAPPYHAIEVTGALFHTQGGLKIDGSARVLRPDGTAFDALFAGGGAACGVSGPDVSGYLSGNGLLTAFAFGALAGRGAARLVASSGH